MQHTHKDYRVNIDFEEIPDDINWVTVKGKTALLKTVLSNLIDNACKYSDNKTADVIINSNSESCIVSIADTGIGIPQDEIKNVFVPFYRSKNATSYTGSGIGLSICQRIVKVLNGKISVQSEIGAGSTFTVEIPHV